MLSACAGIADVAPLDSSESQGSLSLFMQPSSSIRRQSGKDLSSLHISIDALGWAEVG